MTARNKLNLYPGKYHKARALAGKARITKRKIKRQGK